MANTSNPLQIFNFHIEIEGLVMAGFSECTGLQVEIEAHTYLEGGVNGFEHQLWGRAKYPRLILKRGLTQIDGLWDWYWDVTQGKVRRKNGTIYLQDSAQRPIFAWHLLQALPLKWTGPELKADSATVAFESIEVAHKGLRWEKVK
jgi:phage tail-like protein